MKTIQSANPSHHHNGFVATCQLWTTSGGVHTLLVSAPTECSTSTRLGALGLLLMNIYMKVATSLIWVTLHSSLTCSDTNAIIQVAKLYGMFYFVCSKWRLK